MKRNLSKLIFRPVLLTFVIVLIGIPEIVSSVSPGVMQSTSYIIQSDSINFGGGLSTSTNFVVSDTLGEVGTGFSSSTNFSVNAGFQAMQQVYIAISDSADIALPNVGGISGGNSTGQSTWTVTTDDPAGYSLSVYALTDPAMKSASSSISDYPATTTPDFTFAVDTASSTFGFTAEGVDIVANFKDNGSNTCNTGSTDTLDKCWRGFSTTPIAISRKTSSNHPNGSTTTIKYEVGIGSNKIQDAGAYTANLTVTAVAL